MKAKSLTFKQVNILKRKSRELESVKSNLPEVIEPEIVHPPSQFMELPEDRGIIDNWLQRFGINSATKLYSTFNEMIDQVYRARQTYLQMQQQEEDLEASVRQRELNAIDHQIALREREIHMEFLDQIERARKNLTLSELFRLIAEHDAEKRLKVAKAEARAREYEEE